MIKRALDILLAFTGLVILSPLFFLLAVLVKISDFGPVLFVHQRVGRGGRNFPMYKFRTMVVDAASKGGALTVSGDKRVTFVGGMLRRIKADELPQLWNVLKGDMSFVGPRPEVRRYVDLYSAEQCRVLEFYPGITDLASFAFFNESDLLAAAKNPEQFYKSFLIPEKIRINLEYAAKANVLWDILVITATVLRSLGLRIDLFSLFNVRPPRMETAS
jgi:lipopolysaccharide/colanic/teichoic acid biosynthesis glycosyltransferase